MSELASFNYTNHIKTIQLHREGWELSYPILDLSESTPLLLTFDDISQDPKTYSYTIIHCNSDWEESRILQNDYLDGYHEEVIDNFEYSRNTQPSYIHYSLSIPNEDIRPVLSGNYVVKVFEDYDREHVVFVKRFMIVDYRVEIEGDAIRTNNLNFFNSHHEIDFRIDYQRIRIDDPYRNIKVRVVQNFDWQTAIQDLQPSFVTDTELTYDYEEENLFPGLSEFRFFDTKNLKFITERIERIEFQRPEQHVFLYPDQNRSIADYDFYEDLNGEYYIKWDEGHDSRLDAQYYQIHFRLPFEAPLNSSRVYLYGALTDWNTQPQYEMTYNLSDHNYELTTPLKQGYYNYMYRVVPQQGPIESGFFEGNHFETENDYLIFVYYQKLGDRHEQLVGFQILNSVKKKMD